MRRQCRAEPGRQNLLIPLSEVVLRYEIMRLRTVHWLRAAEFVLRHAGFYSTVLFAGALSLVTPGEARAARPEQTASEFVKQIQEGAIDKAKRLLENSGYRYRHPGGDDIYFAYETGYDPNFAFLIGKPFIIGTAAVREQRSDWYLIDGTIYADVMLPLRFESYRPWVLPAPMAFGRRMEFIDFVNYAAAPAPHVEHLSLRIRPSLEPGLIKEPKPRFSAPPPPVAPSGTRAVMPQVDTYGSLLGSLPVDPAPVVLPSGERLTAAQMSRFLPRLSGITLTISLIRWGRLSSWRVVRWNFDGATVITEKGEISMGSGPSKRKR